MTASDRTGSGRAGSARQADDLPGDLPAPARRALASAGYRTLAQLAAVSDDDLLRLHGMGPSGVRRIRAALTDRHRNNNPPPGRPADAGP